MSPIVPATWFNEASAKVTGASSGLGLAMARALAAGGARVALGARDAGRLGEAVRSLGATTADVRAVPLDVRDSAAIARAIAVIADAWGGLDVLVNATRCKPAPRWA